MEYSRSNRAPVLEEDEDDGDVPLPSHIVRDQINLSDLREAMGDDSISDWARKNVGDTHLGKRKLQKGSTKGDPKRQKGKDQTTAKPVSSDTETDDGEGERSPPYQESKDSSETSELLLMCISVCTIMTMIFVCTLMTMVFLCMIINCCFGVVFDINMCITHDKIFIYFAPGNQF